MAKTSGKTRATRRNEQRSQVLPQQTFAHRARNAQYYLAAAVSALAFLVYFPSLQNGFVQWDDPGYVSENPFIRTFNLAFFKRAFFGFHASNWHPLTWISHALDYAVWGLNPLGHHLTNNVIHAVNTFLVVLLVVKLIDCAASDTPPQPHTARFTLVAAGLTGLLFGLHPLHVESVAWVSERKDLLCALFYVLSIISYLSYTSGVSRGIPMSRKPYILTLLFFALALLSKPMAVSLPLVLLILDWYPFKRVTSLKTFGSALIEKLPFLALSIGSSVLTLQAQKAGGAMDMMAFTPFPIRLLVAVKALAAYLSKMMLPIPLIPYYPYPKEVSFLSAGYLVPILLVAGIFAVCLGTYKRQHVLSAAWGYYLATLIPVIGVVQVGGQAMADRYTYLPSLGPFLLAGLATAAVLERAGALKKWDAPAGLAGAVAIVVVLSPLSYLTVKQTRLWKDSFTLWNYVIEKQPDLAIAYTNLGVTYLNTREPGKAIEYLDRAVALDPADYKAFANRGIAYGKMKQVDNALEDLNRAIALQPDFAGPYNDRGIILEMMGRHDKALEDFSKAILLDPDLADAYCNRGVAYGEVRRFDASIASLTTCLEMNPNRYDAYVSRGISSAMTGRHDDALYDFNKAIGLNHNFSKAYFNRGNLYYMTGRKELGVADFRKACDLGDPMACNVLQRFAK